jgi:hypothetical protein
MDGFIFQAIQCCFRCPEGSSFLVQRPPGHVLYFDTGDSYKKLMRTVKKLSNLMDSPSEAFALIHPLLSEMEVEVAKDILVEYKATDAYIIYRKGSKYHCHAMSPVDESQSKLSVLDGVWGKERLSNMPPDVRDRWEVWLRAAPGVFKEGSGEVPHKDDWYRLLRMALPHSADDNRDPRLVLKRASLCCAKCGVNNGQLKVCAGCATARYCKRECQKEDWKNNHKHVCWIVKYARGSGGAVEDNENNL